LKKFVPKPTKVITTPPKITQVSPVTKSIWAGTGLYERTEDIGGASLSFKPLGQQKITGVTEYAFGERVSPFETTKEITSLGLTTSLKALTKTKQEPSLKELTKLKQEPALKEMVKLKEMTKLKEVTKLKQTQKLKQALKMKQLIKPKLLLYSTKPQKKIVKKTIIPFLLLKGKALGGGRRKGFLVEERRYGKFKQIGTAPTVKKAFELGVKQTKSSLGQTFKIMGLTKGIRTPFGYRTKQAKGETLYMQKRGTALGTLYERRAIQRARGRK